MAFKRAGWMVLGNGFYALFQLLNMVIISKILGVESLGVFSLALALTAPLMLFSNFGMRILWVTNSVSDSTFSDFRLMRLCMSLFGAAITCIFLLLYLPSSDYLSVYILIVVSKLVENNADIFYSKYHKDGEQRRISVSLITRGALGVSGMWVGCFIFESLLSGVFLYAFMWFLSHIFTEQIRTPFSRQDLRNVREYSKIVKGVIVGGTPIAIGLLLANLNMNLPRIQLEREYGLETVGIYSALYFFIQTGTVVITSIGQVILPKLSELHDSKDNSAHLVLVTKVLAIIVLMAMVAAIIIYLVGENILAILFNDTVAKFSSTLSMFLLLSPAQYSVSILNAVVASIKRNSLVMWCQFLMFIMVALLSIILISENGVIGAYLSYGISSVVVSIIYIFLYLKVLRVNN